IFLTTRPDNTSDWAPPRRLFPESEAAYDIPQLLHDGKSFLFQSNRSAGYGASDLWMGQLP
ncbi:MAG: hypothetical protein KDA65_16405, partial [Planctomycetaceae bacterium]|nr:hypothetical protein [Planctomycetaceae bacterium]